jgi:hypothetical protein
LLLGSAKDAATCFNHHDRIKPIIIRHASRLLTASVQNVIKKCTECACFARSLTLPWDRVFEERGFTVVRGPDLLWGDDIRDFHPQPGHFGGIIGDPPCQAFSRLRHILAHHGYQLSPNLIPEFERCVREAQHEKRGRRRLCGASQRPSAPLRSRAGLSKL